MNQFSLNDKELNSDREVPMFEFFYPRVKGNVSSLDVGLCDVRAADNIRITYDFDRDGYVISRDGKEKAFIQAWDEE